MPQKPRNQRIPLLNWSHTECVCSQFIGWPICSIRRPLILQLSDGCPVCEWTLKTVWMDREIVISVKVYFIYLIVNLFLFRNKWDASHGWLVNGKYSNQRFQKALKSIFLVERKHNQKLKSQLKHLKQKVWFCIQFCHSFVIDTIMVQIGCLCQLLSHANDRLTFQTTLD